MSRTRGLQLRNLRARGGGRSVSLGWGEGGTDLAYSPLKVSYRRFSFPRDRPDVRGTKSANLTFCFVLHTPALSGPPPCIPTSCSFLKKLGVCCPSQKNIVVYSHISLYKEHWTQPGCRNPLDFRRLGMGAFTARARMPQG